MGKDKHNNQSTGKTGERLAATYLTLIGYQILQTNWRFGRIEIDLIVFKGDTLHFIEVKTRRSLRFGWPEEHIKRRKLARMLIAIDGYLQAVPDPPPIQLDILSIVLSHRKPPVFWLIEDVFV